MLTENFDKSEVLKELTDLLLVVAGSSVSIKHDEKWIKTVASAFLEKVDFDKELLESTTRRLEGEI